MTCIVGLKHDGKVYIGGDSAVSDGHHITVRKTLKVFRKHDFLFGITGYPRLADLLKYSLNLIPYDETVPLETYMGTVFIDEVRRCLKDGGLATKYNEMEYGATFLVAYKERLFIVENDYQIAESIDAYEAVGCGTMTALGAMFATPHLKPVERIKRALRAASHHCEGVREPFHILCSDGSEY